MSILQMHLIIPAFVCLFFKALLGLILFLEEDKVKLTSPFPIAGVLVCKKCKETVATNQILQIQVNSSTDFLHYSMLQK